MSGGERVLDLEAVAGGLRSAAARPTEVRFPMRRRRFQLWVMLAAVVATALPPGWCCASQVGACCDSGQGSHVASRTDDGAGESGLNPGEGCGSCCSGATHMAGETDAGTGGADRLTSGPIRPLRQHGMPVERPACCEQAPALPQSATPVVAPVNGDENRPHAWLTAALFVPPVEAPRRRRSARHQVSARRGGTPPARPSPLRSLAELTPPGDPP